MFKSRDGGFSLAEVMVAVVILTVASSILFQVFTGGVKIQSRRAVQEEALNFASDYLEQQKLLLLAGGSNSPDFDTIRPFRSDTLLLKRTTLSETDRSRREQIAVTVDSTALVTCTLTVPIAEVRRW